MAVRFLGTVLDGLEAVEVTVEARYSEALRVSEVKVVGLPDAAVKEGMLRARSAAWPLCSGRVPPSGVLVNLAPADLKKKAGPTTYPAQPWHPLAPLPSLGGPRPARRRLGPATRGLLPTPGAGGGRRGNGPRWVGA